MIAGNSRWPLKWRQMNPMRHKIVLETSKSFIWTILRILKTLLRKICSRGAWEPYLPTRLNWHYLLFYRRSSGTPNLFAWSPHDLQQDSKIFFAITVSSLRVFSNFSAHYHLYAFSHCLTNFINWCVITDILGATEKDAGVTVRLYRKSEWSDSFDEAIRQEGIDVVCRRLIWGISSYKRP